MGRKKKAKKGIFDRVGEPFNLDKCPKCGEHPDCFSCIKGKCTALNECGGQDCAFYKQYDTAASENQAAYQKLKNAGRYDLIGKYDKAFLALGVENDEFADGLLISGELEAFEASDYETQLQKLVEAEKEGSA